MEKETSFCCSDEIAVSQKFIHICIFLCFWWRPKMGVRTWEYQLQLKYWRFQPEICVDTRLTGKGLSHIVVDTVKETGRLHSLFYRRDTFIFLQEGWGFVPDCCWQGVQCPGSAVLSPQFVSILFPQRSRCAMMLPKCIYVEMEN